MVNNNDGFSFREDLSFIQFIKKFPDTNPAGILKIHIGDFYALNYFISYSNRTGKHQDKEDSIAFVLWNPPLLYLEYHFFIFQSENIRYGLEYHLSIYDIHPLYRALSSLQAFRQPLSASANAYFSVALVKAVVEVFGTAPGILATA